MIVDHFIRPNHDARVPHRWVWLDTEADQDDDGAAGVVQRWRLGVTAFDRNDTDDGHWIAPQWATHETPEALWEWVDARTRRRARTVVVAHNLGYDLRISRALDLLPALGWSVHRFAIHERSCSLVLKRADRTLVLADSMAWLPMSLATIAGMVGTVKAPLPDMADDWALWEHRCRTDVETLRLAMLDLVAWWQSGELGNWQRSGAGQAWSHWRHAHYTHRVLVHSDERARAAEVAAMSSARCEAWRHGRLDEKRWTEWDLPLAYPSAAAELQLPVQLWAETSAPSWGWVEKASKVRRVLVSAHVDTPAPVLPVALSDRTLWPVGTFSGTWWEHELQAAVAAGAHVTPTWAWSYKQAPALASWARWAIDAATDPAVTGSYVRQAAAKHMSRALIGKFAVQWTPWQEWTALPFAADPLERVATLDTDRVGRVLTLGERSWIGWEKRFGADAVVAITSAIMAEVRCRLWAILTVAGLDHVAYCDTDSVVTDQEGSRRLRAWLSEGGGWGLRVKRSRVGLTILGPRQLIVGDETRVSGVPKGAQWVTERRMAGTVWESVETALRHGRTGEVVIRPATWTVKGIDRRREHRAGGKTAAFSLVDGTLVTRGP